MGVGRVGVAAPTILDIQRAYFAGLDEGTRMARMINDITLGVPKCECPAVTSERDGETWDRLAHEIHDIKVRGQMPVLEMD